MIYESIKAKLSSSFTFSSLVRRVWEQDSVSSNKMASVVARLCKNVDKKRLTLLLDEEAQSLACAKKNYNNIWSFSQYLVVFLSQCSAACILEPDQWIASKKSNGQLNPSKITLAMLLEYDLTYAESCL